MLTQHLECHSSACQLFSGGLGRVGGGGRWGRGLLIEEDRARGDPDDDGLKDTTEKQISKRPNRTTSLSLYLMAILKCCS